MPDETAPEPEATPVQVPVEPDASPAPAPPVEPVDTGYTAGGVPTFESVREKIETRYAKAKGMAELQDMSVESKMLEVEQASINVEAQARLSEIRSKLGIG